MCATDLQFRLLFSVRVYRLLMTTQLTGGVRPTISQYQFRSNVYSSWINVAIVNHQYPVLLHSWIVAIV